MTSLPPHLLASIDRINAALEVAVAQPPPATGTLCVCQATEDEWNAFVDSKEHNVQPNFLEWFADTKEIHIIEFADAPHGNKKKNGNYISESEKGTSFAERNVRLWIKGYMDAENLRDDDGAQTSVMDHAEQHRDPCFLQEFQHLMTFGQSKSKLESLSRGACMAQGQLDHKAISIWAVMPGIEYVLCVKFDPDFANAEYKLYDARVNPLVQLAPLPIPLPIVAQEPRYTWADVES